MSIDRNKIVIPDTSNNNNYKCQATKDQEKKKERLRKQLLEEIEKREREALK